MEQFKKYTTSLAESMRNTSEDFQEKVGDLIDDLQEKLDDLYESSSAAEEGKSIIKNLPADGIYELIYHFTDPYDIEKYADEALDLSPGDVSLDLNDKNDAKEWEDMVAAWEEVQSSADEIAAYNAAKSEQEMAKKINKIFKSAIKQIK